jgi:hypothetical protein
MSWPSFDLIENDCYNHLMIDSYEIESSEWGSPSCDQAWELDSNDYQQVDQIAFNNFQPFESEKIRRTPPQINYIQRENFPPLSQQTNSPFLDIETAPPTPLENTQTYQHFPKKEPNILQLPPLIEPEKKPLRIVIKVVNKAKEHAQASSEEDIDCLLSQNPYAFYSFDPISSRTRKRKSTSSTESTEPKRRKITKLEIAPSDNPELDDTNEEFHANHRTVKKKDLKIPRRTIAKTLSRKEKRIEAYLRPSPPDLISEPSQVDIKLTKYIQTYYGKIPPRKNAKMYEPLLSRKIVISKLNTIDDHIKELALKFFKKNFNSIPTHLTRMFDILCHKALIDEDKEIMTMYMNKYLELESTSPTISKDRIEVMDRLMKDLKKSLNELKECEAEWEN